MKIEKKIDDASWDVLMWIYHDIEHKAFFTPREKSLIYTQPEQLIPGQFTSFDSLRRALYLLQDKGAIEIIEEYDYGPRSREPVRWEIKLLRGFRDFLQSELKSDTEDFDVVPERWKWFDKKAGKYQFGDKGIFEQTGKTRKRVFQAFMDVYEKSPQAISVKTLKEMTKLGGRRIRIEINAINSRLAKKIGIKFSGTRKGHYILNFLNISS